MVDTMCIHKPIYTNIGIVLKNTEMLNSFLTTSKLNRCVIMQLKNYLLQ